MGKFVFSHADALRHKAKLGFGDFFGKTGKNIQEMWRHRKMFLIRVNIIVIALTVLWACGTNADDWPVYRKDSCRSATTAEKLKFPLKKVWVYEPAQPPTPAWPEPGKELHRIDFDYAFHPVIADGMVYFGSSANDTVYALNIATGELVWRFITGGPVRFAPSIANGKVYATSDDGFLYCLDAKTGEAVWKFQGAPENRQLLGNGRMISRWPMRSGVLVVDNIAYCAAGMWPTQGVYVYALNAETGNELWRNDSSGNLYTCMPHPGASGFSGVAPQGYLLVSGNILLVNTGRGIPAAFDRHSGNLLYYLPGHALKKGGSRTIIAGDLFFSPRNSCFGQFFPRPARVGEADVVSVNKQGVKSDGMIAYSLSDGRQQAVLATCYQILVSKNTVYTMSRGNIEACERKAFFANRSIPRQSIRWTAPHKRVYSMACTENALLVGGKNTVTAFDVSNGKRVWQSVADERVRGFAVAEGRMIVATQKGTLACFEHGDIRSSVSRTIKEKSSLMLKEKYRKTAANITEKTGRTRGYALVVGKSSSQIAAALAEQTDLHVVAVVDDEETLQSARQWLLGSNLHGSRVAVQKIDKLSSLPFAPYFASVVVVSGQVRGPAIDELYRLVRPCGGKLILVGTSGDYAKKTLQNSGILPGDLSDDGRMIIREALSGAGEWRYEGADGGRTGVGRESRARLPLELLWFGGPGPDRMLDRGARTSTPLSVGGRVFVTGENHLIAFDAYTGCELWCKRIEKVGRVSARHSSANFVADDDHVYVAVGDLCYQINQVTGETTREYHVPEEIADSEVKYKYIMYKSKTEPEEKTGHMEWGYLTVTGDIMLGTYRYPLTHQWDVYPRYGNSLFALSVKDGSLLWLRRPKQRIPDDHIVFGEGKVFFLDTVPTIDIEKAIRRGENVKPEQALIALDLRSGKELWRNTDIPAYQYRESRHGNQLQYSSGLVVLAANAVYEAGTGKKVWQKKIEYARRALIYKDQIIAYPHAYNIRTGARKTVKDPLTGEKAGWKLIRTYGCGTMAGCENLLFFRSGVVGLFDMNAGALANFGGIRPGCTTSMIAANGLLIVPEASSGCSCSYNFQTSFALVPTQNSGRTWYVVPRLRSTDRIKKKINLGAPGAKFDKDKGVWQSFSRMEISRHVNPAAATILMAQASWYHHPSLLGLIKNSPSPWIYTSGLSGYGKIALNLEPRAHIVALVSTKAPKIDGILDDSCWKDAEPIPFAGNGHLLAPRTTLLMRQDTDTLYFAYHRQPALRNGKLVPLVAKCKSDEDLACRKDDYFEIHLTDARRQIAAHFGINSAGARFDGNRHVSYQTLSWLDPKWNSGWEAAVKRASQGWTTEIAISKECLEKMGAKDKRLKVNCMSQNLSGYGPERIYLRDPELGFKFCSRSLYILDKPKKRVETRAAEQRAFNVRLHFAELNEVKSGERVFNVSIQGKPVLQDFDIVRQAGSRYVPVVKDFTDIKATDFITIDLCSASAQQTSKNMRPIISGIEVTEFTDKLVWRGKTVIGHNMDLKPSQIRGFCGLMDEVRVSNIARTRFPVGPYTADEPLPDPRE